jgi:hypothetical protein
MLKLGPFLPTTRFLKIAREVVAIYSLHAGD